MKKICNMQKKKPIFLSPLKTSFRRHITLGSLRRHLRPEGKSLYPPKLTSERPVDDVETGEKRL